MVDKYKGSIPPKPETITVRYAEEIVKPLTIEQILEARRNNPLLAAKELLSSDYLKELKNLKSEKLGSEIEVWCSYSWCPHDKGELQEQLQESEEEKELSRKQALKDIDNFGEKFIEYDRAWENYRNAVEFYISDMKSMGKGKDGVSTAMLIFPPARFANDVYGKSMESLVGRDHQRKIREIYNTHVVSKYNLINNGYSETRNKGQS